MGGGSVWAFGKKFVFVEFSKTGVPFGLLAFESLQVDAQFVSRKHAPHF